MKYFCFFIGLFLACQRTVFSYQCDRTPSKAIKPPEKINNKYVIEISGNPKSYTPGENYTITLKSNPGSVVEYRFSEFTIVAEPQNPSDFYLGRSVGSFSLIEPIITMFNSECPNTVIQTNTFSKTSVSVLWSAPPSGSGCISIKATVFESGESWFMDTGELTKSLCEENEESEDIQPPILEHCCACDEAKYEVAFQGLWSRNTHPKDFPDDIWKTKLGDVIGASHKYSKSFWNYGGMATDGLKLLAEEGDTSELEKELKDMVKSEDIRTIIKARELSHPKITGTSYTVFRVDQENHLISLVSKIIPSPDWIVGVANLELCLENCSWAESRTLNLYPWDVGTDDGLTYNSPDLPSDIPQLIRRIKSNSPNREESPFYSEDGEPIKPLAKLHLTRQKLYEKECKNVDDPSSSITVPQRHHKCKFGNWSEWSSCSVTCGKGVKTRDRPLLRTKHYKACLKDPNLVQKMQQTDECEVETPCDTEPTNIENDCPNTEWGPWTECSAACGTGTKTRTRQAISDTSSGNTDNNEDYEDNNEEEENENPCSNFKEEVECYNPECSFGTLMPEGQIIAQSPDGEVVDCKVSKWSVWGPCDISQPCKKRYKAKERHILIHPQNGGKACPKKLQKKKRCGCKKDNNDDPKIQPNDVNPSTTEEVVDCVMGPWSKWSPCSTTCGYSVRQRTRNILVFPSKNGQPCGVRVQMRKCPLPLACNDGGMNDFYR